MIITVDCNSDVLLVDNQEIAKLDHPNFIIGLLESIFDKLDDSTVYNISLERINEDKIYTIGEW